MQNYVRCFTSESVSEGHPDKLCDIISDALLDAQLQKDPNSRCAFETLVTVNTVILAGEAAGRELLTAAEREDLVRRVLHDIGYHQDGFDADKVVLHDYIHLQSRDIAEGVDRDDNQLGAGDQGLMFGYACSESDALMPAPIFYANRIMEALQRDRRAQLISGLGPDAKIQLTFRYENHTIVGLDNIVLSTQHHPDLGRDAVRERVMPYITTAIPAEWVCPEEKIFINPAGRFVVGGPVADTGLTGRKIVVDTYGGAAPHGGGAFSGKDATKVDRSGAYMARYIARNVVRSGIAERCTIQIAYGIGLVDPLSLSVDLHGTSAIPEQALLNYLWNNLDLSPRGIIDTLGLQKPIFKPTASYGHFGRNFDVERGMFSWESDELARHISHEFAISDIRMT